MRRDAPLSAGTAVNDEEIKSDLRSRVCLNRKTRWSATGRVRAMPFV